ncbi:unnamed protein product [Protopolystoma xenopodis]|uniref:Uncharacterized protein n=1 Tax=Protopolystoma xenopodis TaxID=117903 RepID=A0A3S5CH63_9PLAT|nr:unnamed protein product [Protopolystoma xenopodis]
MAHNSAGRILPGRTRQEDCSCSVMPKPDKEAEAKPVPEPDGVMPEHATKTRVAMRHRDLLTVLLGLRNSIVHYSKCLLPPATCATTPRRRTKQPN